MLTSSVFGGVVSMAAAYTIWGNDQGMFPPMADPTGDPKTWTKEECQLWLNKVRVLVCA